GPSAQARGPRIIDQQPHQRNFRGRARIGPVQQVPMNSPQPLACHFLVATASVMLLVVPEIVIGGPSGSAADGQHVATERDGQHDFDFEIGAWKTHVSRLLHPLTGSTAWAQYDGTSVVRKIWNGRANLVELEADGPAGHLELASWRLYNPESHQWSLNVASSRSGVIGAPTIGEFNNSRCEV